jgi:hypothetical protein
MPSLTTWAGNGENHLLNVAKSSVEDRYPYAMHGWNVRNLFLLCSRYPVRHQRGMKLLLPERGFILHRDGDSTSTVLTTGVVLTL